MKEKMRAPITIEPGGGLGNQLFIYGAGLALARHVDAPLQVKCASVSGLNSRTFELDLLEPDPSVFFFVPARTLHARVYARAASKMRRVCPSCIENAKRLFGSDSIYREPEWFQFSSEFWSLPPGITLRGYFQSWKYLDPIAAEIRSRVLNAGKPSEWVTSTAEKLEKLGSWTSVHIRRGDYLSPINRGIHGVVERGYYEQATKAAASLEGHENFVVFSDDVAAAKELFSGMGGNITFIDSPPETPALETMQVMAHANACVIANSSFSWWGAWLTDHPSKTVIAPRPWFDKPTTNERDLLPSHWLTIGR